MPSAELYKVLGGMLALGEFSPRELARFADVDERAVHRILSNEGASYVQQRESDRPVSRYSLIPSARNGLREQLRTLERMGAGSYEQDQFPASGMPASLSVAEDILLNRLSGAVDDLERSRFIGFARLACEDARSSSVSVGLGLSARVEIHRRAVESALRLSEAEMAASRLGSVKTEGLIELWSTFSATLALAVNAGDPELVQRLSFRYLSSPLGQLLAQSQFAPFPEASIQPRPILLFDVNDPNTRAGRGIKGDAVSSFVRTALEQSHVTYTPVPLFQADADNLGVQRSGAFPVSRDPFETYRLDFTSYFNLVQPVCILPVPSGREHSAEIVDRFNDVCRNQPDRLVVDEKFDPQLNNLTFSQHGRYVPIEGLGTPGFMGAVFNGWPSSPPGTPAPPERSSTPLHPSPHIQPSA